MTGRDQKWDVSEWSGERPIPADARRGAMDVAARIRRQLDAGVQPHPDEVRLVVDALLRRG